MVDGLVTPNPELLTFDPVEHRFYYAGSEIPGVSRILMEQGHVKLDHIPPDVLERAAQIGTEAHRATEIHDQGGDPQVDPLVWPALCSYRLYLKKHQPIQAKIEQVVLGHYQGMLYGGILDRLWTFEGGRLLLVDLKTSNEIYNSHKIQVCAYAFAEGSGATPAILKLDKKKGAMAKLYELTPDEQKEHTDEWIRCLTSWYYKKRNRVLTDGSNKPARRSFGVRAQREVHHPSEAQGEGTSY